MIRNFESSIKIACRDGEPPLGQGATGVCYRVVKVKITQNQVRVRKKRKQPLGQSGAVGRTICAKKIHRGDPTGAVGGSKQAYRGKNINRKHIRGFVKNSGAGQVLVQSARNINGHTWAARSGGCEGHKSRESRQNQSSGRGVLNSNKQRRVRQHSKAVKK